MSWDDVGKIIGKTAPVLGSLFGPIGSVVGTLVATIFGVKSDPQSVLQAVQNDPDAQNKLLALQVQLMEASEKADTARLEAVNTTMQAEVRSTEWFDHWRSAWGWLSAFAFFSFIAAVVYSLIANPTLASALLSSITPVSELFIIPGVILGVVSWHQIKQPMSIKLMDIMQGLKK